MNNIEKLANIVLENDEVPDPKIVTVVPTVRTNAEFPPPSWFGRSNPSKDSDSSQD